MDKIPKITKVQIIGQTNLLIYFDNGVEKKYDCKPLLERPEFQLLKSFALFKAVNVDPGGYGISWNDEIDISEYELWENGETVIYKERLHHSKYE